MVRYLHSFMQRAAVEKVDATHITLVSPALTMDIYGCDCWQAELCSWQIAAAAGLHDAGGFDCFCWELAVPQAAISCAGCMV